MFYLKYRPQKFSELISPNPVADALAKQAATQRTSHAYLFVGPRGTGKTTTARLLAKALNCTHLESNGDPCDKCENCEAIRKGNFMDLIEIDAASNRGIDDIRNLRDRIGLAPSQGSTKVYIIDEVHMLTTEAFNALLKTLEEPPAHAVFILCTTEPHKVPDTIKSRCQVFNFKRATLDQLVAKLELIAREEGEEVSKTTLRRIAQASFGGFRDAETMLQQVIQGELDAENFIGASDYGKFLDFVGFLVSGDGASALRIIENAYEQGTDMAVWSYFLLDYLKGLLFLKMDSSSGMVDVTEDLREEMVGQAQSLSVEQLVFYSRKFMEARNEVGESGLPTLPLELAVAEVCECRGFGDGPGDESGDGGTGTNGSGQGHSLKTERPSMGTRNAKGKSQIHPKKGLAKPRNENSPLELSENDTAQRHSSEASPAGEPVIPPEEIKAKWNNVLRAATKYNHSVRALLKSTQVVDIQGSCLILEAQFEFHKDRLEYSKNRRIVEDVLQEVFSLPLTISCVVKESKRSKKGSRKTGTLTDRNVVFPDLQSGAEVAMDESLLEVFDGNLPL